MPSTKKNRAAQAAIAPRAATNGAARDVLTLAEAADYLRVTEAEIIAWVHSQELPGRFTGREWRFLRSALRHWLATGALTKQSRKEAQLALAGKYKNDPDLSRICEEAARQRGCSPAEDD